MLSNYNLFQEHTGRVFRLQFDEFQIVSSSHDDTILIWDFLNSSVDSTPKTSQACTTQIATRSPSRKYKYTDKILTIDKQSSGI